MSADGEVMPRPEEPQGPEPKPKAHIAPVTAIRAQPPKPQRLSRKTLMAGSLVLSAVVAFALVNGFSERDRTRFANEDGQPVQPAAPPESVRIAQAEYSADDLQPPPEEGHDFLWGDAAPSREDTANTEDMAGALPAPQPPSPLEAEADAARVSSLTFGGGPRRFPASPSDDNDEGTLGAQYSPPRSPYTIQAGSTISAALVTALNSDQPGRVVAQVTENVYDSVSGDHLLVPQGARLIGTYNAATSHGDQRLLVVWNRLIMPNGWSIPLRGMPGTDATGVSGLHDTVDTHIGRIAVASLLSGVLAVAANEAEGDDDRLSPSVGDATAQQAAGVGSRIVDRELNVRPTLRIRAGATVRVLVSQDIVLRPYAR